MLRSECSHRRSCTLAGQPAPQLHGTVPRSPSQSAVRTCERYDGQVLCRTCHLPGLALSLELPSIGTTWITVPGPCSLLRHERAVFIGTVKERPKGHYHFRVDERFKGAIEGYFDVDGLPSSTLVERFQVGKQYLVFAIEWPYGKKEKRVVVARRPTRELSYAQALLEQLRAENNGKRNASVYGTLLQTLGPRRGDNEVRPAAGAVVWIQSKEKSFEIRSASRCSSFLPPRTLAGLPGPRSLAPITTFSGGCAA